MTPSASRSASRLKLSNRFARSFRKLDGQMQDRARAALRRFREDPQHPALHFEALQGTDSTYSIRVNRNFRILLELLEDSEGKYFVVLDVANHDVYDRL